jgi:hypothetical protein
MSHRTATWLAWSLCVLSLALTALGFFFLALSDSHPSVPVFDQWLENAVVAVCFSVVGAVITPGLPSRNPIGWFFCAIALVGGARLFSAQYAAVSLSVEHGSLPGGQALTWIASWLWVLHVGLFVFLALLFPDGKLASGRWRPFAWFGAAAVVVGILAAAFSPGPIRGLESIDNPLGIEGAPNLVVVLEALIFGLGFGAAASMFARLRRARGVERQQLKWFAYAVAVLAGGTILTNVVSNAMGVGWLREVGFLPTIVGLVGWPVAVGIAISRYRLYDIDILINRTLVYGSLTVTLAFVYFGGVAATEAIFRTLTGQEKQPQLAVVVSTLVIAALFIPLRRPIQAFIDRRFYRRKYDAVKTLESFSTKLRDETDLEALSDDLVGVVSETMQPAHVFLWLRPPAKVGKGTEKEQAR